MVSTNKYFVSDAVLGIEPMERNAKIKSLGFDECQKRLWKSGELLECDDRGNFTCTDAGGTEVPW